MSKTKPFNISKREVWEAFKQVKANKGSAGIDNETIQAFESNLPNNLYKLWNRLSSGSYFPPPVKRVKIPKPAGGTRVLGIPTVSDRIAQMVVKTSLEPHLEPHFHPDSYGYRPNKSALEAVGVTRKRCWRFDWVIDLDIKGFFDHLDHDLLMRALDKHTSCKWIILYIKRWLKAPHQNEEGELTEPIKGVPQGSVIGPLFSNLFLHYAFDEWMRRNYPKTPFARFADDSVVHCKTREEAVSMLVAITKRLQECGLELHPNKTKIVYCKDDDRKDSYPHQRFDFLGYTFRSRRSKNRWGKHFINFTPAVSDQAKTKMRRQMRGWRLHLRTDKELSDLSGMFNSVIRGWINYYGAYYKSALYPVLRHLNRIITRWATRKYKRLRGHRRRAEHWLGKIARRDTRLFYHWQWGVKPLVEQ